MTRTATSDATAAIELLAEMLADSPAPQGALLRRRAAAALSTATSRSGSGRVRRDITDFGSFSAVFPPADPRLLVMLRILAARSTSAHRRPAISPRRNPDSASSHAWPFGLRRWQPKLVNFHFRVGVDDLLRFAQPVDQFGDSVGGNLMPLT